MKDEFAINLKDIILIDLFWSIRWVFNDEQKKEFEKKYQISYDDVINQGQAFRNWLAKQIKEQREFEKQITNTPEKRKALDEMMDSVMSQLLYGK